MILKHLPPLEIDDDTVLSVSRNFPNGAYDLIEISENEDLVMLNGKDLPAIIEWLTKVAGG